MNRFTLILLVHMMLLCSCESSEESIESGNVPVFSLDAENSLLEPVAGGMMYIRGKAADDVGLLSVEIQIPTWQLKKNIDLADRKIKEYDLDYKFKAPDDATDEDVEFTVIVTDLGGLKTVCRYYISATGDNEAPLLYSDKNIMLELLDSYTIVSSADVDYDFRVDVVDNKGLKSLTVACENLNLNRTVGISGTEFSFVEPLKLTSDAVYTLKVVAEDLKGNKTEKRVQIAVANLPNYPKMYLADVDTDKDLNTDLFGVPMLIDKTGDYTFSAKYYAEKAGAEVRFLTDKTTFSEMTFGESATENGVLVSGTSAANVPPIILPKANQYYQVDIDLVKKIVKTKEINPGANPHENITVAIFPWYDPFIFPIGTTVNKLTFLTEDYVLQKNPQNSYMRSIDCQIKTSSATSGKIEFYFTNKDAWYPCWRFDATNQDNLETVTYCPDKNTKGNASKMDYTLSGDAWYTFYLDTYLNRIKAVPKVQNE